MWLRRGAQADPPESPLREDGPPGPAPWPSSHACDPPPTGASWSATTGSIALPRGDPPVHCGSQIEQSHQPRSVPFRRSCRATHGKVGGTHPRRRRRRWARRTGNPAEFKSGGGRFAGGEMQYSCFGVGKKQGVLAAAHRTTRPPQKRCVSLLTASHVPPGPCGGPGRLCEAWDGQECNSQEFQMGVFSFRNSVLEGKASRCRRFGEKLSSEQPMGGRQAKSC